MNQIFFDCNNAVTNIRCSEYSLHTFTLRRQCSRQDYHMIKEYLISQSRIGKLVTRYIPKQDEIFYGIDSLIKRTGHCYFLVSEQWGINYIELFAYSGSRFENYYMDMKINPRKMLHPHDNPFIYIANRSDIDKCKNKLEDFLELFKVPGVTINTFYMSRIDYCVNIDFGDWELAETYLRLLKKSRISNRGRRLLEKDVVQKRYVPTKNSFTVRWESYEVSFYSKYRQLFEEKEKYDSEEIERAKGIIRFEIRCERPKIRYEIGKGQSISVEKMLDLTNEYSSRLLKKSIKMMCGDGTYRKAADIKQIIRLSSMKNTTKEKMCCLVDNLSKNDWGEAIRQIYLEDYQKQNIVWNNFILLGVSPFPIEYRNKFNELPSILEILEKQLEYFETI